jgi:hypothetical protein
MYVFYNDNSACDRVAGAKLRGLTNAFFDTRISGCGAGHLFHLSGRAGAVIDKDFLSGR